MQIARAAATEARIIVMHEGRLKGIVDRRGATQQGLLELAMT